MKSDSGDRIATTPAVFREWRSVMAEKAREHGIEMEMTDRREFATPPAFTRNQVRPVSREGRTEHVGTSEAAQARYDAKRSGRRTVAKSDRSRQYIIKAQEAWQRVALAGGDHQVAAYATQHQNYLESSVSTPTETSGTVIRADFESKFRINLATLQEMVLEDQELREMSRAEFETYEKKVETALFKLERSVSADDRADFDEIAGLTRDFVNQKRELVDLYAQRKEALAEQSGEAPRSEPRDSANDEWDAAVAKHGEAVVEGGNEAMIEIEHYREGLDRIEAGEFSAGRKDEMQAGLQQAMERAAQLAVEGNRYLRDVAGQDQDLRQAIERAERQAEVQDLGDDERADVKNRDDDRPIEEKDKAPANVDAVADQRREVRGEPDRQPIDNETREAHELASTVDATNRLQDRLNRDKEAAQRSGETTRTDPAQQRIPRLEELEREQMEQRERDRDDRDR